MIITNSGGAWTIDEFKDGWVFFVGQSGKGVQTYGTIASNTATTITCSGMIYGDDPAATGKILIYMGYSVEFLPDVSQPSVVRNLNVNQDCFEYSDNDDKRKLSTKVVATGKDLFGKTISVMVAAVHAYDETKQFFSDATIVTCRSEGYIQKNNSCPAASTRAVTVSPSYSLNNITFSTDYPTRPNTILPNSAAGTEFPENGTVVFHVGAGGTLPSGLVAGTVYYIGNKVSNTEFKVYAAPGGALVDIGSSVTPLCYITTDGGLIISNTDGFITNLEQFILFGATAPDGLTFGSTITNNSPTYSSATYYIRCGTYVNTAGTDLSIVLKGDVDTNGLGELPTVRLYGGSYTIPSGSSVALSIPNSGVAGTAATTAGFTLEGTDASGTQYTDVFLSKFTTADFSGRGFLLNKRLYVQTADNVGNNEVLIGEEKVTIASHGLDTIYGDYIQFSSVINRVTSSILKSYPHDVGALVARTNYTEAAPEEDSAIAPPDPAHPMQCGIHIGNFTVDGNITYGTLDGYAAYMLLGLGYFYKMATTWCPLEYGYVLQVGEFHGSAQSNIPRPIEVGDWISTTEFTASTPVEYEVVEVTIKLDEGRMLLQLGDFEKNVFTSLQQNTNALNRTLT
jgi:hypothetical protein